MIISPNRIDMRSTVMQNEGMTNTETTARFVHIDFAADGPVVHHHSSRPTGNVVGPAFTEDTTACTACNWGRS